MAAVASVRDAFPARLATVANAIFILSDSACSEVGCLWIGRDQSNDPSAWWVRDILIEAEHRGKGCGEEGMLLSEDYARSQGAPTLGLSVFGINHSTRGLHELLSYETTSIKMRKNLA
ncbi:GNAT family N-acetyltransferase [Glutamicibacter protophormiae]|uniref:GNAT superfamily N-acetyltransferase n=1 Tax=Glutamicibacter protophormiae TaxID=37930 RepID=A0ABS4XQP8_GLUPR|nr:GNAT family N-acetyltransferase [Glutamicibacter protophormiae]MBP2398844.1 GNAT superfamily N-acetyltransferase [Glutamicibacter protophormiae]GGL82998.1 hypothetical protein GCM10010038_11110 [Glutamicibacter protophormiae]